MDMEELELKIKDEIIKQLNLDDLSVEDIGDDAPLFGDEFGLDSIDALELIVMMDKSYGIKITDPEEGRKVFQTVSTIANYIRAQKG